jgi:hypothetical protein
MDDSSVRAAWKGRRDAGNMTGAAQETVAATLHPFSPPDSGVRPW